MLTQIPLVSQGRSPGQDGAELALAGSAWSRTPQGEVIRFEVALGRSDLVHLAGEHALVVLVPPVELAGANVTLGGENQPVTGQGVRLAELLDGLDGKGPRDARRG